MFAGEGGISRNTALSFIVEEFQFLSSRWPGAGVDQMVRIGKTILWSVPRSWKLQPNDQRPRTCLWGGIQCFVRQFLSQLPCWGKGTERRLSVWWWVRSLGTEWSSGWLLSAFCEIWFRGEGRQRPKLLVLSKWYLALPIISGSLTWLLQCFAKLFFFSK